MLEAYFLPLSVAIGQRRREEPALMEIQPETSGVDVISNNSRLRKTLIVIGVTEDMLDADPSAGSGEGLLKGLAMRPAWLRSPPRWLALDEIDAGEAAAGWQGLLASGLDEEDFDGMRQAVT